MPFHLEHLERKFTKADAFVLTGTYEDEARYANTTIRLSSFILARKSDSALQFIEMWLVYSQDERALTDDANTLGKSNFDGFYDHRHDQSIFSLLTKKWDIIEHMDPSQYGNEARDNLIKIGKPIPYNQIITHDRDRG